MSVITNRIKKTVSVTVSPDLYQQARSAKLNFSAILSEALRLELKKTESERWKKENADGLAELNRISQEHGLLSDKHKVF